MKKLLIFCIFYFNSLYPVVILVHGTFASTSDWHYPHGEFYKKLEQEARLIGEEVIAFRWSGGTTHNARLSAAQNLAKLIKEYALEKKTLIGHSHGGNVINIASTILADELEESENNKQDKSYLIDQVYLLATPIDCQNYEPNMEVIGTLCNMYSKKDWVQSAFGLYKRCLNKHERIVNLQIIIHHETIKKHPSHSQMHHPLIAQWILSIPNRLIDEKTISFDKFSWNQDGIIYLDTYNKPYYEVQNRISQEKERPLLIASAS